MIAIQADFTSLIHPCSLVIASSVASPSWKHSSKSVNHHPYPLTIALWWHWCNASRQ